MLWVRNVKTGKRLPLQAEPKRPEKGLRPGDVVVSPNREKGQILLKKDLETYDDARERIRRALHDGRVHVTHFADCPESKQWQGRKRS